MIDIVIPLGTGSKWNNNELRYCLRSIERHLKNYRNIYIVGELPEGYKSSDIVHVPCQDIYVNKPSCNILNKILTACSIPELSADFILFNDDFFLLKDIDAWSYPHYYDGLLCDKIVPFRANYYDQFMKDTISVLTARNLSSKNFDIHTPIIYNKDLFPVVMREYDFLNNSLVIKSLYCNTLLIEGVYKKDCKIIGKRSALQFSAEIRDQDIFSTGDQCLLDWSREESPVKTFLKGIFPKKSKYEL